MSMSHERKAPATASFDAKRLAAARLRLLRWYGIHKRDLPWRRTRDAYRIWISEIMLQQTRVDTVVSRYGRFLRRFPSLRALARAPLANVLHEWSGLGYYVRARNLHAAARRVVAEHGGQLPRDAAALRALPGIGRYTAGAILSLAHGMPEPILDGNVARVFARTLAIDGDVSRPAAQRRMWETATRWAASPSPGDVNQALMELGAVVCTPAAPDCARCPLAADCEAHRTGREHELPQPRRRPAVSDIRLAAALVRRGSRLLLVRRRGRLLQDWWEVPTVTLAPRSRPAHSKPDRSAGGDKERMQRALDSRLGIALRGFRRIGSVRHGILSHRLEVEVLDGGIGSTRSSRRPSPATAPDRAANLRTARATVIANLETGALEARWLGADRCRSVPLTTLTRKVLRAAASTDPSWSDYLGEEPGEHQGHHRRHHPAERDVENAAELDRAHTAPRGRSRGRRRPAPATLTPACQRGRTGAR
jgi:A/G-specific adenine glycosylase